MDEGTKNSFNFHHLHYNSVQRRTRVCLDRLNLTYNIYIYIYCRIQYVGLYVKVLMNYLKLFNN